MTEATNTQAMALPRELAELSWTVARVARLDLDVATIAARLGLRAETSRGHGGPVRSVHAVLGEYEYVFTGDGADPAATTVWSRPARDASASLIGFEEYWSGFRKRPGMYLGPVDFAKAEAYLYAFDLGSHGRFLEGLYGWLLDRLELPFCRLGWQGLAELAIFEPAGGKPARPWSKEVDDAAVESLFALLDEFFAWRHAKQVAAAAAITAAFAAPSIPTATAATTTGATAATAATAASPSAR